MAHSHSKAGTYLREAGWLTYERYRVARRLAADAWGWAGSEARQVGVPPPRELQRMAVELLRRAVTELRALYKGPHADLPTTHAPTTGLEGVPVGAGRAVACERTLARAPRPGAAAARRRVGARARAVARLASAGRVVRREFRCARTRQGGGRLVRGQPRCSHRGVWPRGVAEMWPLALPFAPPSALRPAGSRAACPIRCAASGSACTSGGRRRSAARAAAAPDLRASSTSAPLVAPLPHSAVGRAGL